MKIKYAFLDGTVTEVEVSEEIGAVIIDSRKAEHTQDERHRYHCYHRRCAEPLHGQQVRHLGCGGHGDRLTGLYRQHHAADHGHTL